MSWLTKTQTGLSMPFLRSRWVLEKNKAKIHLNLVLMNALRIVTYGVSRLLTPSEWCLSSKSSYSQRVLRGKFNMFSLSFLTQKRKVVLGFGTVGSM